MPFFGKYFIKKKGKGLKERLQGNYRKRENTSEILQGIYVTEVFEKRIFHYPKRFIFEFLHNVSLQYLQQFLRLPGIMLYFAVMFGL